MSDLAPGGKREKKQPLFSFSPNVELGHLLQVVTMLAFLGGWAIVGYQSITKQLDQHAAEMAMFKQRLTTDEAALGDLREALRQSNSETRQQLAKITDMLGEVKGDIKAVVATQGRQDVPRR